MSKLQSEILSRAVTCRLLSDQQIDDCRAGLPADANSDALLSNLLKSKLLTRWQVKQLQAGKTAGYFVAQYKLLEPIGAGGMGQVFRAADANVARRQVAIKILPRQAATPAAIARFRREGATALQLQHDHIVRCFELGQQGETHFLVMELVEGATLKDYITKQGKLSVQETARIGHEVALALEHAWQQQIVHRDIKPSNILLTRDNRVKLTDMGLAKFFGPQNDEHALATRTGMLLGTLDYLAPEQAEDAKRADIRSDIYALGCTLYHCLTGEPPFSTGTEVQKIMAHREQPVPPIAERNKEVENLFADIIEKRMLAKRPGDRYQTPAEVAANLEPWMGGASRSFNVLDLLEQVVEKDAASGTLLAKPPAVQADWETYREHERKGEAAPSTRPVQGLPARVRRVGQTVGLKSLRDVLIAAGAMLAVALILFGFWRADRGDTQLEQPDSAPHLAGTNPQADGASGGATRPDNAGTAPVDGRDEDSPAGWIKLFNGQDLTGWTASDDAWQARNGVLEIQPGRMARHASLVKNESDRDFELRLQCRVLNDGGISVGVRDVNDPRGRNSGLGVLLGTFTVKGQKQHLTGNLIHLVDTEPIHLVQVPEAQRSKLEPAVRNGDWLDVLVRCEGPRIVAEINGERVVDYIDKANKFPLAGPLGLYASKDDKVAAEVRNIRLRELSNGSMGDWIDVLAAIDPNKLNSSSKNWTREGTRLVSANKVTPGTGKIWTTLTPSQSITGDYDVEVDFLFGDSGEVPAAIQLPLNETNAVLSLFADRGTELYWIDGKVDLLKPPVAPHGNPTPRPKSGVVHHITASVRHQGENVTIETYLNGALAGSFSGRRSRLSCDPSTLPVRNRLKLNSSFEENAVDRRFEIHRLQLRLAMSAPISTLEIPSTPTAPATSAPATSVANGSPKVLFVDEYDQPQKYWSNTTPDQQKENPNHLWGFRDGISFDEVKAPSWYFGSLPGGKYPDCSWEMTSRVVGNNAASRGGVVLHLFQEGRGIQVRIDGVGALWIAPSSVTFDSFAAGPWVGPVKHPAIHPGGGAYNKIRLDIRKRRLDVLVNDVAVVSPLEFDWDLTPVELGLGVDCQSPAVRAEHDRVEIRELLEPANSNSNPDAKPIRFPKNGVAVLPDGTHCYEGASLRVAGVTSGVTWPQWDMQTWMGIWTSDCQLAWTEAKSGGVLTLDLPIEAEGLFQLVAGFTLGPDFARVKLALDGESLFNDQPIDLFDRVVQPAKPVVLGTFPLTRGKTRRLTVTIAGKNRSSTGFVVGLDELRLVPVK